MHKSSKKLKYISLEVLSVLIIFIFSLLPYRKLLENFYVGEPFDTRLQMIIHEHWKWVFQGERDFRDLRIFYPFENTLGFSDGFFINGIIHSILRSIGLESIPAWNITNILILFLGCYGFYLLGKKVIRNRFLLLILMLLITNNYTLMGYLHLWPNILGYLLISWPILITSALLDNHRTNLNFNLIMTIIPFYCLSYWYPSLFFISGVGILLLYYLIINKFKLNKQAKAIITRINLKSVLLISPVWLFLWYLFFIIYWPNRSEIKRAPEEIIRGSLSVKDFFSTNLLGGSKFQIIYEKLNLDKVEQPINEWAIGFSPIMFVLLIGILFFKKIDRLDKFLYTSIILILLIFINFNGLGIFIGLWNNINLLQIIRTPARFNLFVLLIALFLIFRFLDGLTNSKNRNARIFVFVLPVLLILDNFRIAPGKWTEKEYIDTDLLAWKTEIVQNCEYFVVTNPGAGHWSDTMDGVILSSITNVPTINGYSGSAPEDRINRWWADPTNYSEVQKYIERQQLSKRGCVVSKTMIQYLNVFSFLNILSLDRNIEWEHDTENYWFWFNTPSADLRVINVKSLTEFTQVGMYIEPPPCMSKAHEISVKIDEVTTLIPLKQKEKVYFLQDLGKPLTQVKEILVDTDFEGCRVKNDNRKLFYRLVVPKN